MLDCSSLFVASCAFSLFCLCAVSPSSLFSVSCPLSSPSLNGESSMWQMRKLQQISVSCNLADKQVKRCQLIAKSAQTIKTSTPSSSAFLFCSLLSFSFLLLFLSFFICSFRFSLFLFLFLRAFSPTPVFSCKHWKCYYILRHCGKIRRRICEHSRCGRPPRSVWEGQKRLDSIIASVHFFSRLLSLMYQSLFLTSSPFVFYSSVVIVTYAMFACCEWYLYRSSKSGEETKQETMTPL